MNMLTATSIWNSFWKSEARATANCSFPGINRISEKISRSYTLRRCAVGFC